jgi:hypothetical protein
LVVISSVADLLAAKLEQMFHAESAAYPVERTLLTTGVLEACLHSRHKLNQRLEKPPVAVSYQPPAGSHTLAVEGYPWPWESYSLAESRLRPTMRSGIYVRVCLKSDDETGVFVKKLRLRK